MTSTTKGGQGAGNPLAVKEYEFLQRFWNSDEVELDFSRSFFFDQPESPRIQELLWGDEEYYRTYKRRNLERIRYVAEFAATLLSPGASVLDVGCGLGQLTYALKRRGLQARGIDLSQRAVQFGRRILEEMGSQVQIDLGDALDIPYPQGTFDAVVSCDVIEHVPEQRLFLSEIYRALKPGGRMIIHTDNKRRVRAGVLGRRLLCILKGRSPFCWDHAWSGIEGGHCALITPLTLRKLSLEVGFMGPGVRMCGSRAPLLGSWLAPKFIFSSQKPKMAAST